MKDLRINLALGKDIWQIIYLLFISHEFAKQENTTYLILPVKLL